MPNQLVRLRPLVALMHKVYILGSCIGPIIIGTGIYRKRV